MYRIYGLKMLSRIKNKLNYYLNSENIIIYQMGKVGSTSLEKSLPNSFHTHTLYAKEPNPLSTSFYKSSFVLKTRYFLIRNLIKRRRKIKIISVVRHPLERNFSMFFHDLPEWLVTHKKMVLMIE